MAVTHLIELLFSFLLLFQVGSKFCYFFIGVVKVALCTPGILCILSQIFLPHVLLFWLALHSQLIEFPLYYWRWKRCFPHPRLRRLTSCCHLPGHFSLLQVLN